MSVRLTAAGLLSLSLLGALGIWPDWLPALPDWGREWELADLEQSLDLHPPVEIERWLYNPRERTERALDRLAAGGADASLAPFETAARLAPADRRVLFNAGTARLLADHGNAVAALEAAVAEAPARAGAPDDGPDAGPGAAGPPLPPELLQRAWYNLGTARLTADDAAGAVEALEEALRRDPADLDAKFNLEVALRRLDEARLRMLPSRETPGGEREGDEADGDRAGGSAPEEAEDEAAGGSGERGTGERSEGARPEDGGGGGRRPVAGFEEQRDLTAAQAAALLDAVESLERRERQIEAARSAAAGASEEEDW